MAIVHLYIYILAQSFYCFFHFTVVGLLFVCFCMMNSESVQQIEWTRWNHFCFKQLDTKAPERSKKLVKV